MPRLHGRFLFVRHSFAASVRLREIEGEIREILRNYPDLAYQEKQCLFHPSEPYEPPDRPHTPPGLVVHSLDLGLFPEVARALTARRGSHLAASGFV